MLVISPILGPRTWVAFPKYVDNGHQIGLLQPECSPEVTGLTPKKNHPRQIGPLPPLPDFPADFPDPLPFAPSEDLPFPCQVAVKGMAHALCPAIPGFF